jgi:hypothetical protein
MDVNDDKDAEAVPPASKDDCAGQNRSEGIKLPPTAGRICRVAAGLANWAPEEKPYLKDHLELITYHDQLQAALQEAKGEAERKSNLQARIDEAKNKTPAHDDDCDHGPARDQRPIGRRVSGRKGSDRSFALATAAKRSLRARGRLGRDAQCFWFVNGRSTAIDRRSKTAQQLR